MNKLMSNECKVINCKIEEFRKALIGGLEGIVKASRIYVEAIDEDILNQKKFQEEFKDLVPSTAWSQFEAVGRKWMHPRLLLGGISSAKKVNIIKRLPYSLQDRIFNHDRFSLLTVDGQTLNVDVIEATPDQTEQIFNQGGVRSLGEQRAYIESLKKAKAEDTGFEIMPYSVSGGKVFFRRGCELTKAELKRILNGMEWKKKGVKIT